LQARSYLLVGPAEQGKQHRSGDHRQAADHFARTERIAEHGEAPGAGGRTLLL
jgi:hypothetical protein